MSAIVLMGAGASFGSGACVPAPPPLGWQLFDELKKLGGPTSQLPPSIASEFQRDFEAGMHLVRTQHDGLSAPMLREMGLYFAQFEPTPENRYCVLAEAVKRATRPTTMVSLNYEVMLELACARSGLKVVYQPSPAPRGSIRVLKIHGSCNFLPNLPIHLMRGIEVEACTVHVEAPIRVASIPEVRRHCEIDKAFPPAMALYAPGKEVLYSPAFVRAHQAAWTDAAKHAATIFIIGVRLNLADAHVWDAMGSSRAAITYVGGEPDDVRDWARENRLRNFAVAGSTFAEGLPVIARGLKG